jgi:hypothetical protein
MRFKDAMAAATGFRDGRSRRRLLNSANSPAATEGEGGRCISVWHSYYFTLLLYKAGRTQAFVHVGKKMSYPRCSINGRSCLSVCPSRLYTLFQKIPEGQGMCSTPPGTSLPFPKLRCAARIACGPLSLLRRHRDACAGHSYEHPLPLPPLRWRRDRLVTTSLPHTQHRRAGNPIPSKASSRRAIRRQKPYPFPQRSRVGAAVRPRSCFFSQSYTSPRASTPQMYFSCRVALHVARISTPSLFPWAFSRPTTLPDMSRALQAALDTRTWPMAVTTFS